MECLPCGGWWRAVGSLAACRDGVQRLERERRLCFLFGCSFAYGRACGRKSSIDASEGKHERRGREIAEQEYLVHNAAPEARTVIVEQPRRQGWELDSEVKPIETTPEAYRFRVNAAPGETVRLHIGERHVVASQYQVASFDQQQLEVLLRSDGDDAGLRAALRAGFAAKRRVAALDGQLSANQAAVDEIGKTRNGSGQTWPR